MTDLRKILVIEDEPIIAMSLEDQLREMGFEVVTASMANSARDAATSGVFDLAIVDFHLGNGTAEGAIAELRARKVPVILCSGSSGAQGELPTDLPLLAKPYSDAQMRDAIAAALGSDAVTGAAA